MAAGLGALRILVIDDNAQMRTILGTVLSAAGVGHLHYAPDGRSGLTALVQIQPDLCFVDYEMPVMNGLDFISNVRAIASPLSVMPIIMLTGHADEPRLRAARDRGVSEFLCKPVSAKTILSRLQVAILHPREFIRSTTYFGPDRRRRTQSDHHGPRRRKSDHTAVVEL
ncbi:response regulator [Phenylobacterium sp.]|uniref:response regulator n=1 Tax=Phenylobacterium sp. TaxID=1871053 RepID=UPI00286C6009|nr:response regulator [Phenylobacterium sp.]